MFLLTVSEFISDIATFYNYKWPRNFAIALAVELFIAQPIARFAMVKLHKFKDNKENNCTNNEKITG